MCLEAASESKVVFNTDINAYLSLISVRQSNCISYVRKESQKMDMISR